MEVRQCNNANSTLEGSSCRTRFWVPNPTKWIVESLGTPTSRKTAPFPPSQGNSGIGNPGSHTKNRVPRLPNARRPASTITATIGTTSLNPSRLAHPRFPQLSTTNHLLAHHEILRFYKQIQETTTMDCYSLQCFASGIAHTAATRECTTSFLAYQISSRHPFTRLPSSPACN